MIQMLPVPSRELPDFCRQKDIAADAPLTAYTATQGEAILGWCAVTQEDPCRILGVEAEDTALADGLLRAALFPLYEAGAKEYRFNLPPSLPLPERFVTAGPGELAQLFAPCGK